MIGADTPTIRGEIVPERATGWIARYRPATLATDATGRGLVPGILRLDLGHGGPGHPATTHGRGRPTR